MTVLILVKNLKNTSENIKIVINHAFNNYNDAINIFGQPAFYGGDLGELLETSIGVFQILGKNSDDEFSWGGTLNTLNKEKTAYVNVKQRYEID